MAENITLPLNNLYVTGSLFQLSETETVLLRTKLVIPLSTKDEYYTVRDNDRLDKIAHKKYSSYDSDAGKYWWVIADVNNIDNPLDISGLVGQSLRIPDFSRVKLYIP